MIKTTNNSKVLVAIIVILMITNIVLVSLFLLGNDGGKREKRMDRKAMIAEFLKNEIGFNAGQLQQYDTLSNKHREKIKNLYDSLKSSRDTQFKQLAAGDFSDSVMNMVADQSATSQKMMTMQMYNHVKNIRLLCTPGQLPRFDSLFVKVLNKRGNEGRKKHH
jgi:hypothetical protein